MADGTAIASTNREHFPTRAEVMPPLVRQVFSGFLALDDEGREEAATAINSFFRQIAHPAQTRWRMEKYHV